MTPLPAVALIKRELITRLRSRSFLFCVLVFVGLSTAGVMTAWPGHSPQPHELGRISERLLGTFNAMVFVGCLLLIPGIAGTAITVEKERETLDLLTVTLIRPWGIIAAKLLNIGGIFLLLIASALPVFGCIFFLVGVAPAELIWSVVIAVTVALSCTMVGILCSSLFRKTQVSVVVSYLAAVLVAMGGWWVLARAGLELLTVFIHVDTTWRSWENLAPMIIPLMTVVVFDDMRFPHLLGAVAYQMALGAVCFFIAVRILGRPPKPPRAISVKPIDDPETLKNRRRRFPFYLVDPSARVKPIADHRNPMFVKELRSGLMGRMTALVLWFLGSFLFCILIGVILIVARGEWGTSLMVTIMAIELVCVLVITPALVAGALSKEHELGNMDMLRMTLLSPWQIVSGKLLAGIITVAPMLAAIALASLPYMYDGIRFPGVVSFLSTIWVTGLECVLLSLSLGLFASVVTRRTATSILLSYGLNFMVFIGFVLICGLIDSWDVVKITRPVCFAFSPVMAYIGNLEYSSKSLSAGGSFFTNYWSVVTLIYAALTCGIIRLCVAGFARFHMRERDRSMLRF